MSGEDYIGAEEAGRILRVSSRMVYRYAKGDVPKLRTMRAGRRVLFNRADVLAYADELGAENKPAPQADIIRADDLLRALGSLQAELVRQAEELGELRGRLSRDEEIALRERLHETERARDRLQWELDQARAQQAPQESAEPKKPVSWWNWLRGRNVS